MALHIIHTSEDPSVRYRRFAVAQAKQVSPLQKLFGCREGSVTVSLANGPERPLFLAVAPDWKRDRNGERLLLKRCYEQILHFALQHDCEAISISLLTAGNPKFPAHIDFSIAVETIQTFLRAHPMEVFLISASRTTGLRRNVTDFLHRNYTEQRESNCFSPFSDCPPPLVCSESREAPFPRLSEVDFPEDFADLSRPVPVDQQICMPKKKTPVQTPRKKAFTVSAMPHPDMAELEQMLRATDAGFSETLLKLIDKSGKKDSEIYTRANVSRQHFSKIRNNPGYKPTKPTAIAFAIALELDLEQTEDLIGRAGFALTNSSKFDVIIMYFIRRRHYNMYDINETLYAFDQSLLGS